MQLKTGSPPQSIKDTEFIGGIKSSWILENIPAHVWVQGEDNTILFSNRLCNSKCNDNTSQTCHRRFMGSNHECPCCVKEKVRSTLCPEQCLCAKNGALKHVYHFPLVTEEDNSIKIIKFEINTAEINKDRRKPQTSLSLFKKGYRINTSDEFMTICSSCKNIRDDRGEWIPIERCMHDLYGPDFSHGICLSCAAKLYPGLFSEDDNKKPAQT